LVIFQQSEYNHSMATSQKISIMLAARAYLDSVTQARSPNTARTYKNGMRTFLETLVNKKINPQIASVDQLSEDAIAWLATALKDYSPATERLYLTAAVGFYEYLSAESLTAINLSRVRLLIRQRARRPGQRLPQFPKDDIDTVLEYAEKLAGKSSKDDNERLRNLRDRAFLLTLADTGLRVHEACNLRRGDLDWNEGRAIIIGKGDRQAVVRFSNRALAALKTYLAARGQADGKTRRPLTALPLFARHDKGAGAMTKPITTATGRNIVNDHVARALGPASVGRITPHSFRHYFVTRVLQASGNLKLAQELARHRNIAVTQRYAHLSDDELDKGYYNAIEGLEEQ
jgi:integrase/recombinase XerC